MYLSMKQNSNRCQLKTGKLSFSSSMCSAYPAYPTYAWKLEVQCWIRGASPPRMAAGAAFFSLLAF